MGEPSFVTQSPTIIIVSPQNEICKTNNITLKVNVGSAFWVINSVYYKADWLEGYHRIFTVQPTGGFAVCITVNFTEIPDGSHNITVYANLHDGSHGSSPVFFTTNASPPKISFLSIENKTYYTKDIPLNFTIDEPTQWIGYSLDGQENITISQNMTSQELSYGPHSMIIYANDIVGNQGSSEKVYFSIALKTEPFPTLLVVAICGATATVACVGIIFYLRKKKH